MASAQADHPGMVRAIFEGSSVGVALVTLLCVTAPAGALEPAGGGTVRCDEWIGGGRTTGVAASVRRIGTGGGSRIQVTLDAAPQEKPGVFIDAGFSGARFDKPIGVEGAQVIGLSLGGLVRDGMVSVGYGLRVTFEPDSGATQITFRTSVKCGPMPSGASWLLVTSKSVV